MPDVATQPPKPAPPAGPGTDPAGPPVRILVVDDIEANRDVLSRRLSRRGYVPVHADSGRAALDLIAADPPFDLVLLDVMMPGMSGLEVLEHVRKSLTPAQLPIIMATAKDQSEDMVKALNLGANDYVTKPLDFAVLMARVQTQLLVKRSVQQVLDLEGRLRQRNAELERVNGELTGAYERMNADLMAASKIQESYLPSKLPVVPGFKFAWTYEPCEYLAGDFLNVCPLGGGHFGLYVLDVSGHGVAASLLAVAAARAMSAAPDPDSILISSTTAAPTPAAEVADRLNQKFNWDSNPGQFMTLFYALLDAPTRELAYTSAGHPAAVHLRADGTTGELDQSGLPIGIGTKYQDHRVTLAPGDRVYLFSDGVIEAMSPAQELFGRDRLLAVLNAARGQPLADGLARLKAELQTWQAGAPNKDDVSVLAAECVPTPA